jgi:hypothetical protein
VELLSSESQALAGVLFLALVTVESGGLYLVRLVRGKEEVTPFQMSFARAGHAHAGVLLVLALVSQPYVDATGLDGVLEWVARIGVAGAALLMPGGFFFSSMGKGRTQPNGFIVMIFLGAALLAISLTSLGLGLLL